MQLGVASCSLHDLLLLLPLCQMLHPEPHSKAHLQVSYIPRQAISYHGFYGAITCALSMIGAEVRTFHPLEMTLYLPYEYHNSLSASIFRHLHLLGRITEKNCNPLIMLVEWYAFGRPNDFPLHIIAVFTTTNYPAEALFHSQYTITLNAITSKGIFSAYRSLTSLNQSLVGERNFSHLLFSL